MKWRITTVVIALLAWLVLAIPLIGQERDTVVTIIKRASLTARPCPADSQLLHRLNLLQQALKAQQVEAQQQAGQGRTMRRVTATAGLLTLVGIVILLRRSSGEKVKEPRLPGEDDP